MELLHLTTVLTAFSSVGCWGVEAFRLTALSEDGLPDHEGVL